MQQHDLLQKFDNFFFKIKDSTSQKNTHEKDMDWENKICKTYILQRTCVQNVWRIVKINKKKIKNSVNKWLNSLNRYLPHYVCVCVCMR